MSEKQIVDYIIDKGNEWHDKGEYKTAGAMFELACEIIKKLTGGQK